MNFSEKAQTENLQEFARALWEANPDVSLPPLDRVTGITVDGHVGDLVQITITVLGLRLPNANAEV